MFNRTPVHAGLLVSSLIFLSGTIATPAAVAQEQTISIAIVDLERLVAQSAAGKVLQGRLEKFQRDVQAEGEPKAQTARDIRQKVADGGGTLSEEQLANLQKQYEAATLAIRRFQEEKQREGQKMRSEGLRDIEKQLEPIFREIRDEGGYDLILNNVPGVVVMANERIDITKIMIERLNASSP